MPAKLLVDFYGARALGDVLAFGVARAPAKDAGDEGQAADDTEARVATRGLALIEPSRSATPAGAGEAALRFLPMLHPGWWVSAVAGGSLPEATAGEGARTVLISRERRQEPAAACGDNPDCWSWALVAYVAPSWQPRLLASSVSPESQTHMPEPRRDTQGDAFAWLQGRGAGKELEVATWSPRNDLRDERPPRVVATSSEASLSPFVSVSRGHAWLDERDPAGGPPSWRRIRLADGASVTGRWNETIYAPAAAGDRMAFVSLAAGQAAPQPASNEPAPTRLLQVGRVDATGAVVDRTVLSEARDVWEVAWLDEQHLLAAGSEGIEVFTMHGDTPRRLAHLPDDGVSAVRAGDGRLVTVTREQGHDVIRSYRPNDGE